MKCRYCNSEDVETDDATIPVLEHTGGKPIGGALQIMCNRCQAEYIETLRGNLISVYQSPMEGVTEIVVLSDIPLKELKAIFKEMMLMNEGDE